MLDYGFDAYCHGLCELVLQSRPARVYELAIGTGWPFAETFLRKGIFVAGSDISELLVNRIKEQFPQIEVEAVGYDDLDAAKHDPFDVVYCLRSTWYFPDVFRAIDKMCHLTKRGGRMIFDIMNADSKSIKLAVICHKIAYPVNITKNIMKRILNRWFGGTYMLQDPWNIHELPVSGAAIEAYLLNRGIAYRVYSVHDITAASKKVRRAPLGAERKLIFECQM